VKLVFCGTPEFAVGTLEAVIAAGHEIPLVISQPDRPTGRKQTIEPTPVKAAAQRNGIEVIQPEKIKHNQDLRARLEAIAPDAILVVAYGRLIPDWMLALPRHGCINLHGSLLPKYRGAAPIQWAVAMGETLTGVTTMRLDSGLDTGPMLLAQVAHIAPEETAEDLFESLAEVGARLMVKTLAALECGTIAPIEQNHTAATLAPILTREHGRMDFSQPAATLINRWRGFQPWPGAFTTLRGKKLIIHRMCAAPGICSPAELEADGDRLFLGCANSRIELLEVQLEGKKRMTAAEFLRGNQLQSGEKAGE
jgi:methionyl-tRNA formyltransferase